MTNAKLDVYSYKYNNKKTSKMASAFAAPDKQTDNERSFSMVNQHPHRRGKRTAAR